MYNINKAKATDEYLKALKTGKRDFDNSLSKGIEGHLPSLESFLKNINIFKEEDLGIIDIPLKKIKGTYYKSRTISFSTNFFPLLNQDTEFAIKWINLYIYQINEGIRDLIEVYEYMNWFYVVEGNKRVSVLKHLNSFSIKGRVKRIIPVFDKNSPEIFLYYEFLEFYKKTKINIIWFKEEGKFEELYNLIKNYKKEEKDDEIRFKEFLNAIYLPFRKNYHLLGGRKLSITTGEAFIEYIKKHGLKIIYDEKELKDKTKEIIRMLENDDNIPVKRFWKWPGILYAGTKIKIAFIYNTGMKDSAWTFSHEIGRRYIEKKYKEYIEVNYFQNLQGSENFNNLLKQLEKENYKAVFSTSFDYIKDKKDESSHKYVKLTHFSGYQTPENVNTYFGRMYEVRFLCGIIAGAKTENNKIGFVAPFGIPEVIMSINSFALGAKSINPRAKIYVCWTSDWNNKKFEQDAAEYLINVKNVDVITHHQDTAQVVRTAEFLNVYTIGYHYDMKQYAPQKYLTSAIWNWGIYYENIIANILKDSSFSFLPFLGSDEENKERFWGGINSGVVDIASLNNKNINTQLRSIIYSVRDNLINKKFNPFTGPIIDNKGIQRLSKNEEIRDEELFNIDWYVDNVYFQ